MIFWIEGNEVYAGDTPVITFEPYRDGVQVTPTPACTLGKYLGAIVRLKDAGYEKIYESQPPK